MKYAAYNKYKATRPEAALNPRAYTLEALRAAVASPFTEELELEPLREELARRERNLEIEARINTTAEAALLCAEPRRGSYY